MGPHHQVGMLGAMLDQAVIFFESGHKESYFFFNDCRSHGQIDKQTYSVDASLLVHRLCLRIDTPCDCNSSSHLDFLHNQSRLRMENFFVNGFFLLVPCTSIAASSSV